eukprot:scaffold4233_cov142-Skeletonema_dohrnii-CCMP3373.AAC.5
MPFLRYALLMTGSILEIGSMSPPAAPDGAAIFHSTSYCSTCLVSHEDQSTRGSIVINKTTEKWRQINL